MVWFRFYDHDENLIPNIDASDHFPDEVAILEIHGPFDDDVSSYMYLTTMLHSSPKKLEKISVFDLSSEAESSPAFLVFVVLICNKTNSLRLTGCQLSTNAITCVMAATLNGIRCLEFSWDRSQMPTNKARLLLEGVASSPYLEEFHFNVSGFANSQDVSMYFIQALRGNQSLKNVSINTAAFSGKEFRDILKASISAPNVKTLSITDNERELPLDVLQGVLCRKDCTLEKLHLEGVGISTGDRHWNECRIQNVSVTSLAVVGSMLSSTVTFTKITSLFKSLVDLNLSENEITDLSFLDPILFGEISKLKSLDITYNDISEEEMRRFIAQLRKIRGSKVKSMQIWQNGWHTNDESASLQTEMIDALRPNTYLEYVDLDRGDLPLDLNRGGRRVFEASPEPFPTNLLPHVLERASKIKYYEHGNDAWGYPDNKDPRVDVAFWMIQRIAPNL